MVLLEKVESLTGQARQFDLVEKMVKGLWLGLQSLGQPFQKLEPDRGFLSVHQDHDISRVGEFRPGSFELQHHRIVFPEEIGPIQPQIESRGGE